MLRPDKDLLSSQGGDWQRHIEGICRIVELRGPEKHIARHGHALFEDARVTTTISAIAKRTPNFFSHVSWHSVPWTANPRTLCDELYDNIIEIPVLLKQNDAVLIRLAQPAGSPDLLIVECRNLMARFLALGHRFKQLECRALFLGRGGEHSPTHDEACESLLDTPVSLAEESASQELSFHAVVATYWGACVILFSTTQLAFARMSSVFPGRLALLPSWVDPQIHAANIAYAAAGFFDLNAGLWGAQQATFPIGAALHFYSATGRQDGPEMAMLRRTLQETRYAMLMGTFLKSLASASAPGVAKRSLDKAEEQIQVARGWYSPIPRVDKL